jgi:hypothetical protein
MVTNRPSTAAASAGQFFNNRLKLEGIFCLFTYVQNNEMREREV